MADHKPTEEIHIEDALDGLGEDAADNPIALYRRYSADEARAIEKALVRKIDIRILPPIVLIYILNYVRIHPDLGCAMLTTP